MTEVTRQIPIEISKLNDLTIDQTVICDGRFYSRFEPTFKYRLDLKELPKVFSSPLIFFPQTENVDYKAKLARLLKLTYKNDDYCIPDKYTEDDSETQYLNEAPVSFLVLGKPEIGQTDLAKMIANSWNCVNLNPESVLTAELISGSRAAKCINYNLEAGRAVEPEIIMRLLEKRVKSQTSQHRGFIINGFPLLPNINYKEDPISSESAVFNVQEIFEELLPLELFPDHVSEASTGKHVSQAGERTMSEIGESVEGEDTENEVVKSGKKKKVKKSTLALDKKLQEVDLGPSDMKIVAKTASYYDLADPQKQLEFIFKLFADNPLVIIYVVCDNIDVITKRQTYRYDIFNEQEIVLNLHVDESTSPEERKNLYFDENMSPNTLDGNQMTRLFKLPLHFKKSVTSQIRQYRCNAKPFIDDKILEFDPQNFIKIDGRLSPFKMFSDVIIRLKTLAFQPVLIPERIKSSENFGEDANPEKDFESIQDIFQIIKKNYVGPMYNYQLSNWQYKCPVLLKEGRIVEGKKDFAVKFMNKIYFLSSEDSFIKFYRNPRPYLLPILPNPTCRIWVIGPNLCGKTTVAKCLSILFKCKILEPAILEKDYERKKYTSFIEKLRTAAITEALVTINNIRKQERIDTIAEWKKEASELLQEIFEYTSANKNVEEEITEEQSMNKIVEEVGEEETGEEGINEVEETFRCKLHSLNLPPYSEMDTLYMIFKNPKNIMKYLPEEFKAPVKPATVFDPFVKTYVKTVLNEAEIPDMTLTIDERIDMFKVAIQEAEDEYYQKHHARGGWIIDGMAIDLEFVMKLDTEYLADDIICIFDSDPDHTYLVNNYAKRDYSSFRDFTTFFNTMKKYSVAKSVKDFNMGSPKCTRIKIIESVLDDLAHRTVLTTEEIEFDATEHSNEKVTSYLNHLKEFYQQWMLTKKYLDDVCQSNAIEIDRLVKTDYDILKEAVVAIENKYRKVPTVMTEEDLQEEMANYSGDRPELGGEDDAELIGEEGIPLVQINFFNENRRLGDTSYYCPVVFDRYFVLWKGREEYPVSYQQSVYFLSSESALKEFITDPMLFLSSESAKKIPPPRICIIGAKGCGKSSCGKNLAINYGLHYVNFDLLILEAFNLPITDNIENIFRMDSDYQSDLITYSDKVLLLKEYLDHDKPLNKDLVKRLLTPLWFHEPYVNTGFVLDNFPRRPSDVENLTSNFLIPDIIIELLVTQDVAYDRMYPILHDEEIKELQRKKLLMEKEHEIKFNKWQEDRYNRLQLLLEEKRNRYKKQNLRLTDSNRKLTTPVDSRVTLERIDEIAEESVIVEEEHEYEYYDSIQEKRDLEEINEVLDKEMPAPVFEFIFPPESEIVEHIHNIIDSDFSRDIEFSDDLRVIIKDSNIDCPIISTSEQTADKVFYEILRLVDKIKFRNLSFFERVYEISIDTADKLLDQGYYFMSRFGRTCPVQVYENKNPIQMYLPGEDNSIFPLIHRRYIYFVHTEESRDKFKNDAVTYTSKNNRHFSLIPARIAIIGPPKCGKSILAEKFQNFFHMKIITRGSAIRYVQKEFPDSELAGNLKKVLRRGWSATYEMSSKSVEALTLNAYSISQGYILDGFPNTEDEMKHLVALGIVPHFVIDIQLSLDKIKEYLETEIPRTPIPVFSFEFIKFKFREWKRKAKSFRNWMYLEYQNVYQIDNIDSKWHFWKKAKDLTFKLIKAYHKYLHGKNYDVALDMSQLSLIPYEFFERQSIFHNYCPICWYYFDILEDSGRYPDRTNVIQYLNMYYYVCEKHRPLFLYQPWKFIPLRNYKLLPDNLPIVITKSDDEEGDTYYQDGYCIVCFWDNQPSHVLEPGSEDFMVEYDSNIYLLCCAKCCKNFLRTPHKYFDKIIHFRDTKPIDLGVLRKIPTLGYLEQFAAKLVIESVVNTEIARPLHPGLTVEQSAALNMGMYLKLNNPKTPKEILPIFQEAKEKYNLRRERLKNKIEYFKSRINPFLCLDYITTEPFKYAYLYDEEQEEEEEVIKEIATLESALEPELQQIMYGEDSLFYYYNYEDEYEDM